MTYFAQRYAGEIGSRVMINDRVAQLLSGRLATTILDCVLVVFYAVLMFFYDVTMTLVGIGLSLLNIVAIRLRRRAPRRRQPPGAAGERQADRHRDERPLQISRR